MARARKNKEIVEFPPVCQCGAPEFKYRVRDCPYCYVRLALNEKDLNLVKYGIETQTRHDADLLKRLFKEAYAKKRGKS